ncbi:hypothetical protein Ae201684P_001917 [Aphanomyces euteiches]|uniref:Uncharacterized protein n=1 Tax=Aphanomyces euteiches TaxID=100861 RepID=A0A6G0XKD0_9STRA|nr:hypothetical protein Ae201684_003907 [Aphanomyces euteiches]KAH9084677.1 hypothetical protein Ae201684P_001917 [Aphanomyces euteiches]KAH9133483.1 hypothetical protein AeRB84_020455 [Aphanomyces euteiches]
MQKSILVGAAVIAAAAFLAWRFQPWTQIGGGKPKSSSKKERRELRKEQRRNHIDARRKNKRMQANADRQKTWEEDNANHPIDQDEKQRQYDAKLALKKQQQETLEAKLNFAMTYGLRVAIDLSFLAEENLRVYVSQTKSKILDIAAGT